MTCVRDDRRISFARSPILFTPSSSSCWCVRRARMFESIFCLAISGARCFRSRSSSHCHSHPAVSRLPCAHQHNGGKVSEGLFIAGCTELEEWGAMNVVKLQCSSATRLSSVCLNHRHSVPAPKPGRARPGLPCRCYWMRSSPLMLSPLMMLSPLTSCSESAAPTQICSRFNVTRLEFGERFAHAISKFTSSDISSSFQNTVHHAR